jgi:hypothetical protein
VSTTDVRIGAIRAVLAQLWRGLSAYRLYPGSADRPGFVAAVERIGVATTRALEDGPIDVEIRGHRFLLEGDPLPPDDAAARLAVACFERGVERLSVDAVPDAQDLEQLYAILSLPAAELTETGEAGERLRSAGVTSIALSRVGPAPVEGATHVPDEMAEERVPDARVLASELMLEDLPGSPRDQAETLLMRLRGVVSEAAARPARAIDMHSAVHEVLEDLPPDLRRSFVDLAIERVREDPVAERLIGTMSETELTRALVDLGSDGRRDPVQLARQLASAGVRHLDIVDLTAALAAGHEEAGTIIAGLEQLGIDLSQQRTAALAAGSVTEALSEYLTATEADDARSVRAAMGRGQGQDRSNALLALRDYLSLETDPERVGEVLDVWAEELRDALRDRDARRIDVLLPPVRGALAGPDEEHGSLFEAYARRALDRDLILDLVASEAESGEAGTLPDLLEPFGDLGVEVFMDLLADEDDRERRAQMLGVLRRTVRGHVRPVAARLKDPRWYVVRNAVTLLGSAGGAEVLGRLAGAAEHESPAVRREVATALVMAGGPSAIPHLRHLALEGPEDVRRLAVSALGTLAGSEAAVVLGDIARERGAERALRIQALEELARHPEGEEVLRELGTRAGGLTWGFRRQVRALLRRRRGSGR